MEFGNYRPVEQIGAGPDGIAYRAIDDAGRIVQLHDLRPAHAIPERWNYLARRLSRAALLTHPGAVAVEELKFDLPAPYAVLAWVDGPSLREHYGKQIPLPEGECVALAMALADALAHAHRIGLVHGCLDTQTIRMGANGESKLDFTQLATVTDQPAARSGADPAGDLQRLGCVLSWLATGEECPKSV